MSDTILTFADYADETQEYLTLPRLRRTPIHTHRRANTYADYLAEWHQRLQGEAPPPKPTGELPPAEAFVNCGRWVWLCLCGAAIAVEPGEDLICVRCGMGGWRSVVFPTERDEIETQLLSLPGHRQNAPLREWKTVWSVDDLRTRVAKADALIGEGIEFPRSLSIGPTRVWVIGEILTAANMNQFISQVMEDLAGRNGLIEFEDSISFPDSATNPFRAPRGTTGQRPANPLNGMIRYNTTLNQLEFYNGQWTPLPTDAATFDGLVASGLVGTGANQFAIGNHSHGVALSSSAGGSRSTANITSGVSWSSVGALTATVSVTTSNQRIALAFVGNIPGNQSATWDFRFRRSGTVVHTVTGRFQAASSLILMTYIDNPGIGNNYSYDVQVRHNQSSNRFLQSPGLAALVVSAD